MSGAKGPRKKYVSRPLYGLVVRRIAARRPNEGRLRRLRCGRVLKRVEGRKPLIRAGSLSAWAEYRREPAPHLRSHLNSTAAHAHTLSQPPWTLSHTLIYTHPYPHTLIRLDLADRLDICLFLFLFLPCLGRLLARASTLLCQTRPLSEPLQRRRGLKLARVAQSPSSGTERLRDRLRETLTCTCTG
jgi:hypothetical protein